jgi:hypothetical protein
MTYEKPFLPASLSLNELRLAADHFGWKLPASDSVRASAAVVADAIEAAAELGVKIPREGVRLAQLDELLYRAGPLPPEQRVTIKNHLAAAGLLIETGVADARERTFLTACVMLKKASLEARPHTVKELDDHFRRTNLSVGHRMEIKAACHAAGLLRGDAVVAPLPKPDAAAVRGICAQIDLDPPLPGQKLSLASLNKAIKEKGFDVSRAIGIKNALHAAGALD